MRSHWAHLGLSPFSVILIGYFFQTFDLILIAPVFRDFLFSPNAPIWNEQLSQNNRLPFLMVLLGIHYLGQAASTNFLGALSDRFGRRKLILSMQGLWTFSFFVCALSLFLSNIYLLLVGRFLGGCACSYRPLALAVFTDIYPSFLSRIRSFGLFSVIDGAAAGAFFVATASILHPSFNFIGSTLLPFFLAGFISLFNLLFLWINFPETSETFKNGPLFNQYKELFHKPQLKTIYLLFCLGLIPFASLSLLEGGASISKSLLSISCFLFSACWAISSALLMPKFVQKFPVRSILLWAFGIFTLIWIVMPTLMSQIGFPFILALCGLAGGMLWPIILALISQLAPAGSQGKAQTFAHFIFSICLLIGPSLMFFYFFEHLTLLQYGMTTLLLIAFIILLIFHPRPEIAGPLGKEYD